MVLGELFSEQAARTPHAVAAAAGDRRLTFAQLEAASNQLAHHLLASGVTPGRVIQIHLDRTPRLLVGLLGVLKAGCAGTTEASPFLLSENGIGLCLSTAKSLIEQHPTTPPRVPLALDAPAWVSPRAIWTHAAIGSVLVSVQKLEMLSGVQRIGATSPLTEPTALLELLAPVLSGATVVVSHFAMAELLVGADDRVSALLEAGWQGSRAVLTGSAPASATNRLVLETQWRIFGWPEATGWSFAQRLPSQAVGTPLGLTETVVGGGGELLVRCHRAHPTKPDEWVLNTGLFVTRQPDGQMMWQRP